MLKYTVVDDLRLSSLGLGCSKFGSVRGASPAEVELVVRRALDLGVTVFDTASSYGQGDSERMLGRLLRGRNDVSVMTKVGKLVPLSARVLRPVKPLMRMAVRRSSTADSLAVTARGDALPTSFDAGHLNRALAGSLRRLGLSRPPVVMLHSVPTEVLVRGEAVSVLAKAAERGDVGIVGVSVDTPDAADAALRDSRVRIVQAPLFGSVDAFMSWCARAKAAGKVVVAREVLHGIGGVPGPARAAFLRSAVQGVLRSGGADVCLVGTSKQQHLAEAVGAVV
ncbi:MAG: aldo/keto reductase [Gemmatimonadaceae bacterium]|nr:aldo/keto reductase [Gemmatimonadaceae bacterium]MCW5825411.1 aldo/keto reductase [Gemmatimonadaceae bacterium]